MEPTPNKNSNIIHTQQLETTKILPALPSQTPTPITTKPHHTPGTNTTAINTKSENLVTHLKDKTDTTIKDFMVPTHNTLPAHILQKITKNNYDTIKERSPRVFGNLQNIYTQKLY